MAPWHRAPRGSAQRAAATREGRERRRAAEPSRARGGGGVALASAQPRQATPRGAPRRRLKNGYATPLATPRGRLPRQAPREASPRRGFRRRLPVRRRRLGAPRGVEKSVRGVVERRGSDIFLRRRACYERTIAPNRSQRNGEKISEPRRVVTPQSGCPVAEDGSRRLPGGSPTPTAAPRRLPQDQATSGGSTKVGRAPRVRSLRRCGCPKGCDRPPLRPPGRSRASTLTGCDDAQR